MIKSQTTIVKSSTVESLHYDTNTKALMVTFNHGATYSYFDVTLEDYMTVVTSQSIGSALNKIIKGVYKYEKHEEL
jgi:membrane-bound inhibitor of C-type lysozyme